MFVDQRVIYPDESRIFQEIFSPFIRIFILVLFPIVRFFEKSGFSSSHLVKMLSPHFLKNHIIFPSKNIFKTQIFRSPRRRWAPPWPSRPSCAAWWRPGSWRLFVPGPLEFTGGEAKLPTAKFFFKCLWYRKYYDSVMKYLVIYDTI